MDLKIKSILLYIPWAFPIAFASWFFIQQAVGESKFENTNFLFEILEQNEYVVKRVATGTEVDLGFYPLENEASNSSVYVDPDCQSIWIYFTQNRPVSKVIQNRASFYWVQYNFEGIAMDSLTNGDFPPPGGKTLENKMDENVAHINNERSPLHAKFFQFQSINWSELNPFRYGCSPRTKCQTRGPWKGLLQMSLLMPDGQVEFKIETTKANDKYTFSGHLYEIPSHLTSNQLTLFYLQGTEHPELDKGLYFIYKKRPFGLSE